MKKLIPMKASAIALCIVYILTWCTPAAAISIKEEDKLAREFMKYITRQYELISDPAIVNYVDAIGRKLLAAMPPQPFEYHFYVIKEDVYNAFAIPAGHIFIHSGLLAAMHSEDELAGILGHEIAHVVCRHISKQIERSKKIDLAAMAGMVAGLFLGVAAGNASAMQALTFGSAAAGQAASLAYSREDEAQADQLGLEFITKAGYSPQGLLSTLKTIRGKQWFGADQIPTYMMTHPALEERIVWIDTWAATHADRLKKLPPTDETTFNRIKVRLKALHGEPTEVLEEYENALAANPEDDNLIYGYGLILARVGKRSEAIAQLKRVQAKNALDPFILTDIGRIYFLDGRYEDAIKTLEGAVAIGRDNPDGLFYLGRSQMELGQLEQAESAFRSLIEKNKGYQPAWYFLGETMGRLSNMPEAHYYLGIHYFKKGEYRTARYHLERAQLMLQDPAKLEEVKSALESMGKPSRGSENPPN